MLILAGVSISVLVGENGIFNQSQLAVNKYEEAVQNEESILQEMMTEMDKYIYPNMPTAPNIADGNWNITKGINSPKLISGMIAIYFDEEQENRMVELNAESSIEDWNKWYNYTDTSLEGQGNKSKWANAITKDNNGDITGYYVWIPKYEYQIIYTNDSDHSEGGIINVNFIDTNTTTATIGYKIHPVFETNTDNGGFGVELPGFWVAKYPAGFQANTVNESGILQNISDNVQYSRLKYTTPGNEFKNALGQVLTEDNIREGGDNVRLSYPVFKPLTYVYIAINIDGMYRISQEMKNATSFYNLQNADTHLMKNSEWGAVAYLTWSKWGRNGVKPNINNINLNDRGDKTIHAVTGMYANGTNAAETNGVFTGSAYNTALGQLGSSTGNISGIYDLNGCVWEIVTSYIEDAAGDTARTNNGTSLIESGNERYKMIYLHASEDNYSANWLANIVNIKYGDAIIETSTSATTSKSWNGEWSNFPNSRGSFFLRGGNYVVGGQGGLFSFSYTDGCAKGSMGFRVALFSTL